jgi:uncharacterized protein (DUF58 family)
MTTTPRPANVPPSIGSTPAAEVLRRLELVVTRRLDGILQGDYRGLVPGHGSELGETREYQPGDDVRRMDWNVTARMQSPHVRETIADRELETWVMVDLSSSVHFGTTSCEKRDLALAAVAAAGFLTSRTGNRFGVLTLGPSAMRIVPARTGRLHLMALLQSVLTEASDDTEGSIPLDEGAARLVGLMPRRGLAVIVSDFLDASAWERPLAALAARHETLAVEVVDPRELELPDVGLIDLRDPETGQIFEVFTGDAQLRRRYAEVAARQRDEIGQRLRAAGTDHLVLRTDRDWLVDLVRFVALRRDRIDALTRRAP